MSGIPNDRDTLTLREWARAYAGTTFDDTERSPAWDKPVRHAWVDLAIQSRREQFRLIEGGSRDE